MNEVENLKLRAGSAKPPIGIVPMHALIGSARVLEDSGCHYAPGNYMSQPVADAVSSYDSAWLRHRIKCTPLSGLVTPESFAALDEDTGLPHIDHMIAGLLILRTLMIRDGVLREDPGQGKRKRAKDRAGAVESNIVSLTVTDPAVIAKLTTASGISVGYRVPESDDLAGLAAHESLTVEPNAVRVVQGIHDAAVAAGFIVKSSTGELDPTPSPVDDPDAARRSAAEKNLRELQAQQREATEAKRQRDLEMATTGRARAEGVRL